jgi:hypothetical protein
VTARKTVVVAGYFDEYLTWCREHQVSPADPSAIPILCPGDLRRVEGLRGFDIAWRSAPRTGADEIAAYLAALQQRHP